MKKNLVTLTFCGPALVGKSQNNTIVDPCRKKNEVKPNVITPL